MPYDNQNVFYPSTTIVFSISVVNEKDLQNLFNNDVNISSTCISIQNDTSLTTDNISTVWSVALTEAEETAAQSIVDNYVYVPSDVDTKQLPFSELGNKLAIHSSTKPSKDGKEFYLVWTGSGDDVTGSPIVLGGGQMMQFNMQAGTQKVPLDIMFAPEFGDVYIHEGYAKWENGGIGDHICAAVVTNPTPLQTAINLDLEISNNWVKYAAGGAGTGTHGFAGNPILIKRSKSKDGDWDYDTINGLVPNMSGTGMYKISDIEREVHKYINNIPTFGNSYGYTRLTSDETAYLPGGYFLRVTAHNVSNTSWTASIFMEVFREQTAVP